MRTLLLVLRGIATVAFIYPFAGEDKLARLRQCWSKALLDRLGVRLEADVEHVSAGGMVVANHVSWLDVFAINAAISTAFVAKADVRQWPLLGWLAAKNETVFLRRGSRGHAREIGGAIVEKLDAGRIVAVFPEGTTTDGRSVQHFHAALLQPALTAGYPIVPLAISYWDENGERSLAARYDGDVTLSQSLRAILACSQLTVRLRSLPPDSRLDRRAVAAAARAAIIAAALLEPSTPPGTPADLQDARQSGDSPRDSRNRAREGSAAV